MPEIPDYTFKYHKRGGHTVSYAITRQAVGSTSYYQYVSTDGYWYVMRSVLTAGVTVYTYTVPIKTTDISLSSGWDDRATLDYVEFNEAF